MDQIHKNWKIKALITGALSGLVIFLLLILFEYLKFNGYCENWWNHVMEKCTLHQYWFGFSGLFSDWKITLIYFFIVEIPIMLITFIIYWIRHYFRNRVNVIK